MHQRAETFAARARERYDVDPDVREFPDGTRTAADAAAAVGCDVGAIASSLVFRLSGPSGTGADDAGADADADAPDGRLVVAITSGANRVDEARLAAHFDAASATTADADAIRATLGWSIGGVPPICHDTEVPVVMDPTLTTYDEVWAAAGTPEAVFPLAPERIESLSGATVVDVTTGA